MPIHVNPKYMHSVGVLIGDCPVVVIADGLDDGKSQSVAFLILLRSIETGEDVYRVQWLLI